MNTGFYYNDGGRAAAGYRGAAGDCVCRAIAIALKKPYQEVYDDLNDLAVRGRGKKSRGSSARTGVYRKIYHEYLTNRNWEWKPLMHIGSGCKVHLRKDELPGGTIIVRLSRHLAAVVDGVVNDTHDCTREGKRCVYGYYYEIK